MSGKTNRSDAAEILVYVSVAELYPHPDNPRKDVGDVSELAESIKANGILQNLTVVAGHFMSKDDYIKMAKAEGVTKAEAENAYDAKDWPQPDGYTVIIGHRRLAAAKLAGLSEVPCVIADMTMEEQISTMLTENMQRTDLTVYEQAKAFQQLSIDLGMSVEAIAKKSGFSETTVRRRTKLAELDEKSFKKACERGATLFDFAELDKLEDPAAKQKCLYAMGTSNFKNVLKDQIEAQKTKKKIAKWINQIDAFATRIEKTGYIDGKNKGEVGGEFIPMNYVIGYSSWSKDEDIEKPEDADEIRYFYTVSDIQISVYKEAVQNSAEEEESRKKEEIRNKDEAAWNRMRGIQSRHRELRRDFILNYGAAKSSIAIILCNLASAMVWEAERNYYSNLDEEDLCQWIGVEYDRQGSAEKSEEFKRMKSEQPERLILIMTYWYMDKYGGYAKHDWNPDIQRYVIRYTDNQRLDDLYCFLEELGYERSDEELQLSRGTHELFYKEEEKQEDGE